MFVVCTAIRHQVTPKNSNLLSIKRIFKYLIAYPKLGLWYPRDSSFDLEAFSNSDYAGANGDMKSTTGRVSFLGKGTMDSKPIARLWRTKHIEIRHHFIRDANEKKLIQVFKIPKEHNVADLLTQSFDVTRFGYLVVNIVSACLVCWTNLLQGNIVHLWFLFTSAGRVTFCWLFPIPAGDLVSAGHMLFLLSSPPPIPFGPAPTSGVVSTEPILDIPFSSGPSEPVLDPTVRVAEETLTLTSLLALFPTCLQRIATLKAKLKATKSLHRDTVVLFAKRIKKLESKLKTKKRKLVLSDSENEEEARQSKELDALLDLANAALHEPSLSTTTSKPANPEQSLEHEISPTTLDAVLTLSQSKARAKAAKIIYKRLKKKQYSFGLDFMDADIPAGGLDSAGALDSTGDPSKGKAVATPSSPVTAPTDKELADQQAVILEADRQELLEQELNQSIDAEQVYLDSLLVQRVAKEHDRESIASEAQSTQRQAELDRVALNLTNEEWIGLVDQVRDNPTLSAELLGADVSEDTFSDVRGLTDDQLQIEYDKIRRAVDLATAKDQHQHLKRSDETLESSESKKLKSSHSTTQPAELQETTSVSACVPIAAGDPIPVLHLFLLLLLFLLLDSGILDWYFPISAWKLDKDDHGASSSAFTIIMLLLILLAALLSILTLLI
nr:hypothetical protein [Tanacetum cinerariifolium]